MAAPMFMRCDPARLFGIDLEAPGEGGKKRHQPKGPVQWCQAVPSVGVWLLVASYYRRISRRSDCLLDAGIWGCLLPVRSMG